VYAFDLRTDSTYSLRVNLEEAVKNWTTLGEDDPMWVVLTDPDKKGNRWGRDEFFATGRATVADMLATLRSAGLSPAKDRALDFGCGVGRITQALADHFKFVDGVDISASMLRHAEKFNQHPDRVKYHLNTRSDLTVLPAAQYDFIGSVIALQHTPQQFQRNYLADFCRLLKPGGCGYLQTIHAQGWRAYVPEWAADFIRRRRHPGQAFIPLYGLDPKAVRRIFEHGRCRIVRHDTTGYSGWESRYLSDLYLIQKSAD